MQFSEELFSPIQWQANCPVSLTRIHAYLGTFTTITPKTLKTMLDAIIVMLELCEAELDVLKQSQKPMVVWDLIRYRIGVVANVTQDHIAFLEKLHLSGQRLLSVFIDQENVSRETRRSLFSKRRIDPSYLPHSLGMVREPIALKQKWENFYTSSNASNSNSAPLYETNLRRLYKVDVLDDLREQIRQGSLLGIQPKYKAQMLAYAIHRSQPAHDRVGYQDYQAAMHELTQSLLLCPDVALKQGMDAFIASTNEEIKEFAASIRDTDVMLLSGVLLGQDLTTLLFEPPENVNDYDVVIQELVSNQRTDEVELVKQIRQSRALGTDVFLDAIAYFETHQKTTMQHCLTMINEIDKASDDSCYQTLIESAQTTDEVKKLLIQIHEDHIYQLLVCRVAVISTRLTQGMQEFPPHAVAFRDLKKKILSTAVKYIRPQPKAVMSLQKHRLSAENSPFLYYELNRVVYLPSDSGAGHSTDITYCTNDQSRESFRLHLYRGRLWQIQISPHGEVKQVPFSSLGNTSHGKTNWVCFVMNYRGEIFAYSHTEAIIHSSFLAGGYVVFAGEMKVMNGHILEISNYSGHYSPALRHLKQFADYLAAREVFLQYTDFHLFDNERFNNDKNKLTSQYGVDSVEVTRLLSSSGQLSPYHQCHHYQNGHFHKGAPIKPSHIAAFVILSVVALTFITIAIVCLNPVFAVALLPILAPLAGVALKAIAIGAIVLAGMCVLALGAIAAKVKGGFSAMLGFFQKVTVTPKPVSTLILKPSARPMQGNQRPQVNAQKGVVSVHSKTPEQGVTSDTPFFKPNKYQHSVYTNKTETVLDTQIAVTKGLDSETQGIDPLRTISSPFIG